MERRSFLQQSAGLLASLSIPPFLNTFQGDPIFGHNEKKYAWDRNWPLQAPALPGVKDCHEMVFTEKKELILLTNDTRNNVLFFNKDGRVLRTWGHEFPGGHGLTLGGEGKDAFLLITDTDRHQVIKTTLDGKTIQTWDFPAESGKYTDKTQFVPTETAITPDGNMYVADGYGMQFIMHYGPDGKLKNVFGGKGTTDESLDNAHGICIDNRHGKPTLLVTDRNRCCFKRFTLEGTYIETISLPGANVCRPVISGEYLYAAVLTSDNTGNANTGFVIILNKDNEPVSLIGGAAPVKEQNKWLPMYQTVQLFKHPHDVCVDDEGSLYVCQWNSGNVLPYKFTPHV